MSAKAGFPFVLVLTVLGACLAQAAEPPAPVDGTVTFEVPPGAPASTAQNAGASLPQPAVIPQSNGTPASPDTIIVQSGDGAAPGLSSWITYVKPDCCGPIGGDGSISTQLYATTGPTLPIGGTNFSAILDTGWDVQAGGRSLLFNSSEDAAWTADLSISNCYNHGKPGNETLINVLVTQPTPPFGSPPPPVLTPTEVHLRDLIRTFANAAIGREYYFNAPANAAQYRIRGGMDIGYRFGTAKAEFAEIVHRTDTIYGLEIGWHTDLEIPRGCCTWLIGFRGEWDYTWMGVLQSQNNSDLQDINLLLTLGVRF